MREQIDVLQQLRRLDDAIERLNCGIRAGGTDLQRRVMEETLVCDALEAEKTRLRNTQSRRREADMEMKTCRERKAHFEGQLREVKTNVEYQAMLREIAGMEKKAQQSEDAALEALEEEEAAEQNIEKLERGVAAKRKITEAERKKIEKMGLDADEQIVRLSAKRVALADGLKAQVRSKYERLRTIKGETAIVSVIDGSCSGCHYKLPPQMVNEVRRGERLMLCEGCGRILVAAEIPRAQ